MRVRDAAPAASTTQALRDALDDLDLDGPERALVGASGCETVGTLAGSSAACVDAPGASGLLP